MHAPRRLAPAALLAAAALAPASAGAARLTTMTLDARVSGTQAVGWHYVSDGWPADDAAWFLGSGRQTLSFASSKAFPMRLIDVRIPGQRRVTLFSVAREQPTLSGAAAREQGWDHHVPRLCGGELGDCSTLTAPPEPVFDCATRQTTVRMTTLEGELGKDGNDVRLVLTAADAHPFPSCPPDQPAGGAVASLTNGTFATVWLDRGVLDVARLRRGKSITLTGTAQRGQTPSLDFARSCPPLNGPGYRQCETTKVEVKLTRRR